MLAGRRSKPKARAWTLRTAFRMVALLLAMAPGADIEGGVTNVTIDFDDILAARDAFSGDGYFDNPTHVDPCP